LKLIILGCGGHGKVVLETCRAAGLEVAGFLDDRFQGGEVLGARVLGRLEEFAKIPGDVDGFIVAIGDNRLRMDWLLRLRAGNYRLPTVIHPFSWVGKSTRFGDGSVVVGGAVINADVLIGEGVIVNTGASIDHDCVIGSYAHISPGARLAGGTSVGERTWIGAGAVVIEDRRIGADAIVGAGAVVVRDVPDGAKVVGNPARQIEYGPSSGPINGIV
jgi:sugar O-acyltransferase (sialic acid O-acetyltransferase NeuD family)